MIAVQFLKWLKSRLARPPNELDLHVVMDDFGVSCERSDGLIEAVVWDDLQKVTIMTTDDGPFVEDVFFVLYGSDSGCVIPQGAQRSGALLERLQQLPGFDNEAIVQAMSCATNNEFLCWERAADRSASNWSPIPPKNLIRVDSGQEP